jgi:tetratricopeptide (TPR) repeat protein
LKAKSLIFLATYLVAATYSALSAFEDSRIQKALQLFQSGEYEKALTQFEKAAKDKTLAFQANLGLARVLMEIGKYPEAEKAGQTALEISPEHPEALALLGEIFELTGRYENAREYFDRALTRDPNHLLARLKLGILQWRWGEKRNARQTLQYFIAYYQSQRKLSGQELNLIAQACVYLERFRDANQLFAEATITDKTLWQAFIPWGNLFLSKYNMPDAQGVFEDALKINPNAAEAHLGLARVFKSTNFEQARLEANKALSVNPNFVEAHNFLAELKIALGDINAAFERLEKPLEINPNSLTTRTLRAVSFYLQGDEEKFKNEEKIILAINPKYGDLYFQLGEALSRQYLFKESVEFYQTALALNPDHWLARAGLGTSLSRLGKEEQAKIELEKAFAKDPYNKYVGNLLTLFDSFPQYKTHKSGPYVLRIHERDDPILAGYAMELMNESLADLSKKYTFDKTEPVVVEIFPEHDDFAVRCFGLPGAQAFLGISFGNVVAMDSPRARTKGDFVWGETLWHELVHVTHLRLTENRIPRWLAEGIAVYETSTARPYWAMNLDIPFIAALRNNRLLPLKELDQGFNRPTNPGQVTLSYFQASKVVEFLVNTYGRKKLLETVPEFRAGEKTPEVIQNVFGKDIDALDEEFRNYLKQIYKLDQVDYDFDLQDLNTYADSPEPLAKKIEEKPNNPFLNIQFGLYYKKKGELDKAILYLEKAKELFPRYVLYENPYGHLADIYLKAGKKQEAIRELQALTALNGKDLDALKRLAKLCAETEDYAGVVEALKKVIYISPFDSAVHKKLGAAYLGMKKYGQAIREFQNLILTKPQDLAGAHTDLAYAYLKAGRKSEAKKSALAALEIAPSYERAQEILLESVE